MSDSDQWHWVDADGTQYAVGFTELGDLLRSGVLPSYVLVWKHPWGEWLHATHVAELAPMLGDRALTAIMPRLEPMLSRPPPPHVERYDEVGHRRGTPLSSAALLLSPVAVPQARMQEAVPVRRPVPLRNVMPTLTEEALPGRSSTLRPAGAMPPPPRAIPQARVPLFEEGERTSSDGSEMHPLSVAEPRSYPGYAGPNKPKERTLTGAIDSPDRYRGLSQSGVWLATLTGLLLPFAAGAVFLSTQTPSARPVPAHLPIASAVPAPSAEPPPSYCTLETTAKRLAPGASVGTPPVFSSAPSASRIGVGFAADEKRAVGLTLDPITLQFDLAFQKDETDEILGVVPVLNAGTLSFAVDTAAEEFAVSRTVGEGGQFTLGLTKKGIARRDAEGTAVVWPGSWTAKEMTVPRVATVAGRGHVVTLRAGDKDGSILTGFLTSDGKPMTGLTALPTSEALVGTPSVAASEDGILVTFAGRPSPDDRWGLRFATARIGELPQSVVTFALPPGGPGANAISPSAAAVSGGRYLVQWTEGAAGSRAVRAITLSSNLVPEGEPITLSPPGENAGQAVLWARADRALALFFVRGERVHELWGATLRCPVE